jgi:hypothetical protein
MTVGFMSKPILYIIIMIVCALCCVCISVALDLECNLTYIIYNAVVSVFFFTRSPITSNFTRYHYYIIIARSYFCTHTKFNHNKTRVRTAALQFISACRIRLIDR